LHDWQGPDVQVQQHPSPYRTADWRVGYQGKSKAITREFSQSLARISQRSIRIDPEIKGNEVMSETNSVVAIYPTHTQAEKAVKELQKSGFDMKKMSIVGKDYHTDEQVVGYYNAGDRMKYWGKQGAFWGGI
jgi:hypothetical protein